jgi:hypothetical protein
VERTQQSRSLRIVDQLGTARSRSHGPQPTSRKPNAERWCPQGERRAVVPARGTTTGPAGGISFGALSGPLEPGNPVEALYPQADRRTGPAEDPYRNAERLGDLDGAREHFGARAADARGALDAL